MMQSPGLHVLTSPSPQPVLMQWLQAGGRGGGPSLHHPLPIHIHTHTQPPTPPGQVLCDSWAHNVGIVPSQSCICSPKGGGQRRTESGASARALGENLCATRLGEREILNAHVAAHPQANLTKVRDAAEKYQCQLPLPQPSPHPSPFDSFSYFSHFISCCALPGTVILFFLHLTI